MAWIIGLVTEPELDKLRAAGWRDEDPPAELKSENEAGSDKDMVTRSFFVDSDLYEIMTGPDWEEITDSAPRPMGWQCLRCDWVQGTYDPEPPFTPKGCDCDCWDYECPNCGGAVENFDLGAS